MANFTPSAGQALAINARNKNVLVSAAAGSGKTYVLVQRVMSIISDIKSNINIDNLLVVTFTNKAAAEMRERIGKAINDAIKAEGEKKSCDQRLLAHLQKQLILLNKSHITTIDAFCAMVVKRNFHLIDLDPDFRTVTSEETAQLKNEVMEELLERKYSENSKEFIALSDYFSPQYSDERLENYIYAIYSVSCSQPYPKKWLLKCRKMYDTADESMYSTKWGEILKEEILRKLRRAREVHETAINIYMNSGGYHKALENALILAENSDRKIINTLISMCEKGIDKDFTEYIRKISFARSGADRKTTIPREDIEAINSLRATFKAIIGEIYSSRNINSSLFPYGEDIADTIEQAQAPVMRELIDIVIEFSQLFYERKMEEQVAEFSDIEHMCLNILKDADGNITDSAKELQKQFYEIIIDEYQDSNYLQEEILTAVAKQDKHNMFMVGDIKQAIYRFRMATPEIFTQKYESYSTDINSDNLLIPLSENYRSRASVLDSCNFFFYQLMSRELGEIDYDSRAALYPRAPYPDIDDTDFNDKTEVYIIDTPPLGSDSVIPNKECAPLLVAQRISKMLASHKVYDLKTEEYTSVRPKDIAILLKDRNNAELYAAALSEKGIPAAIDRKSAQLASTQEVSTIIALLNIIDNPLQDIYIIQVLTSSIYNIDSNGLAAVRINSDKRQFYKAVKEYAENFNDTLSEKLSKFLKDISYLRKYANSNTITALITEIYDYTDYYSFCGILENGRLRQANLMRFKEAVYDYEQRGSYDLTMLIDYINNIGIEQCSPVSEGENAVRIMTIHGSKGLEFPIVFVPELEKRFNKADIREDLLIDRDYGIAVRHFDTKYRTKTVSVPYTLLKEKAMNELLSEEMRLLYVAFTRAKEKLVLIGAVSNAENKADAMSYIYDREEMLLPSCYLFSNQNRMMWIIMSLVRKDKLLSSDIIEEHIITPDEIYADYTSGSEEKADLLTELIDTENGKDSNDRLFENISYVYHNSAVMEIPSKISISEIKRMHTQEDIPSYYSTNELHIPDLEKGSGGISGSARGTVYHTAMEHMDFKNIQNDDDLNAYIASLKDRGILSSEEIKALSLVKLSRFIHSSLFKRIQKSKSIYRESPFVMEMSSGEIYGDKYSADTSIVVHGIIDLYFTEGEDIVLVDYKTDYVHDHSTSELIKKYSIQLDLYKRAIEQSTGKKVKEAYIYSIYEDSEILC